MQCTYSLHAHNKVELYTQWCTLLSNGTVGDGDGSVLYKSGVTTVVQGMGVDLGQS